MNSFVLNLGLFTKKVLDLLISRYAIYSIYKVLQIVILSGGVIIARLSVGLAIIRRDNHVPVGPKSLRPSSPDLNGAINPAFQHLKAMVLLFFSASLPVQIPPFILAISIYHSLQGFLSTAAPTSAAGVITLAYRIAVVNVVCGRGPRRGLGGETKSRISNGPRCHIYSVAKMSLRLGR